MRGIGTLWHRVWRLSYQPAPTAAASSETTVTGSGFVSLIG